MDFDHYFDKYNICFSDTPQPPLLSLVTFFNKGFPGTVICIRKFVKSSTIQFLKKSPLNYIKIQIFFITLSQKMWIDASLAISFNISL